MTEKDLLDRIRELCERLEEAGRDRHVEVVSRLDRINSKVRTLELWQARVEGIGVVTKGLSGIVAAVVATVVSTIIGVVAWFLNAKL